MCGVWGERREGGAAWLYTHNVLSEEAQKSVKEDEESIEESEKKKKK